MQHYDPRKQAGVPIWIPKPKITETASSSGYPPATHNCTRGEIVELITNNGQRIDRQRELSNLLATMRTTRYQDVTVPEKDRLRIVLHVEHQARERVRFEAVTHVNECPLLRE